MLARYASAATSGTVITFALLFLMQLLISMQPGAGSVPRLRVPLDWIKLAPEESPVATRDDAITREKLTDVDPTPANPQFSDGLEPLLIHTADPTAPKDPELTPPGAFTDGPLVALVRVSPVYPVRARTYGIEGYVVVQFDVTANGQVVNVVIIESTDAVFDSAAIKAAERFKFRPRVVDGLALATYGIQNRFRFTLDDK